MTLIRRAALSCLPEVRGIFLRCDRGRALYVTNAPALTDKAIDWAAAGFSARGDGKLIFLMPEENWIHAIGLWLTDRTVFQRLRSALMNADFGEVLEEDMALFVEGVKLLDMGGDADAYEKRVRQRAAVCLREKRGGGAITVCGLIADFLNEGGKTDED